MNDILPDAFLASLWPPINLLLDVAGYFEEKISLVLLDTRDFDHKF